MPRLDVEFIGFAPDLPDTTPGIFINCRNVIPVKEGFRGAPSTVDVGMDAIPAECTGIVVAVKLDDTNRLIAGTATHLYERSGTAWSDVSGATYNASQDTRWRFAQVGNVTIAANKGDTIQFSSSGAFADISGAPKAAIVETVGNFVMAFDVNDGVNDYADGWHCSALGDYSDWAESVSTQSASGRLLDVAGRIRAGKRLGDSIVAYKENAMWLGTYVGGDIIWAWQLIPGGVGAVCQETVVEVNVNGSPAHVFMGFDDFYMFDGSRPVSIGGPVRKYFQDQSDPQYLNRSMALHDRAENVVRFYIGNDDGASYICLAYNYYTGKWGNNTEAVSAVLDYIGTGTTWHDMGTLYSTWDDLPTGITYDSPFWTAARKVPAVVSADDNKIYSLTGVANNYNFKTNFFGDPVQLTSPITAHLHLKENGLTSADPALWTRTTKIGKAEDRALNIPSSAEELQEGRVDLPMFSGRWHSIEWDNMVGNALFTGMTVEYEPDGMR